MKQIIKNDSISCKYKYPRKKIYHKNIFFLVIIAIIFIFAFIHLRNVYINNKCEDLIYSIDYNFTHYPDKELRLIEVESIAILSENTPDSLTDSSTVFIQGAGFRSAKPHSKIKVLGTFVKNDSNIWILKDLSLMPSE